jgi:hypothetical protein
MTEETNGQQLVVGPSEPGITIAGPVIKEDGITLFWNDYQEHGIEKALENVRARSESGDLYELEAAVPYLVQEARERGIDMIQFLTQLDEALEVEEEDAPGIDNGSSELHADGGDESYQPEDEDESASAPDVDGEDWKE